MGERLTAETKEALRDVIRHEMARQRDPQYRERDGNYDIVPLIVIARTGGGIDAMLNATTTDPTPGSSTDNSLWTLDRQTGKLVQTGSTSAEIWNMSGAAVAGSRFIQCKSDNTGVLWVDVEDCASS